MVNKIHAGDTFTLKHSADDDYIVKLAITSGGFNAVYEGDQYSVSINKLESAALDVGRYQYQLFVESDNERYTIKSGEIDVLPNLSIVSGDSRSQVKRTLDIINAAIEGSASKAQLSTSINGKSITRYAPVDLIMLQKRYMDLYKQEQRQQQGAKKIMVRI